MAGEVAYVQIVETQAGKYVYEARDGEHKAVETSEEYARASTAQQHGADAYPGLEVRHPVVNKGEPE